MDTIHNIFDKIRHTIVDGLKQTYRITRIWEDPDKNKTIAIDECLFIHVNNNPI